MNNKIKVLEDYLGDNRIKRDVDLKDHLQSGLGGNAEAFYIATSTQELTKIIELCRELKLDFFIIGTGSKVAISKDGIQGVVIKNRSDNLKIFGVKGKVSREGIGIEEALIEADSGASLGRLAEFAGEHGLGGVEIFKSTLGTVGGSLYILPIVREKASQVRVLNNRGEVESKQSQDITREDIILSVVFKLKAKKV